MFMEKEAYDWSNIINTMAAVGLFGVPSLAAYLGHTQQEVESNLDSDKDFERRRRRIKMYNDATTALQQ